MRVRTIIVAFVVAVVPGLALAGGMCGGGNHDQSANICAENQVWDEVLETCIDQVTG
jgi:hypothetical protein